MVACYFMDIDAAATTTTTTATAATTTTTAATTTILMKIADFCYVHAYVVKHTATLQLHAFMEPRSIATIIAHSIIIGLQVRDQCFLHKNFLAFFTIIVGFASACEARSIVKKYSVIISCLTQPC
jgi:hypothetical protein